MTTVSSVLAETIRLLVRSAGLWRRLWPQLIGLMLLGWAGFYAALLAASEVGVLVPFLVVPVFALGLVALLASTVVALRMVASQLGVTAMVREAERASADEGEPDDSVMRLLVVTLLPFLGVYAAFGYVEDMTTQLVLVSSQRGGLEQNVLVQLNPTGSTTAMLITLAVLVGLYVVRRLVDLGYERSGWRGLGLLTAFVEACFLFLALLAGFRVVEQIGLWLGSRRLVGWWDGAVDSLAAGLAVFRIDLPEVLVRLGDFVTEVFWPVFWEGLTQPVAWLAMAALVFGSRVLSLADLWRRGQTPGAQLPGARHLRITRRLQQSASVATGPRRVVLQVQEAFFGDIDDKYLPTFQSLRLMLRAGTVFLGGYIIAFTAVQLVADGLQELVYALVGGRQGGTWIALMPFLDLTSRVLAMSVQVTLLAVAFARVLSIFAERAGGPQPVALPAVPTPAVPTPAAPTPTAPDSRRSQLGQAGVVLLCCAVLAAGTVQFQRFNEFRRVPTAVGETASLMGRQVEVGEPRLGQQLVQEFAPTETTELAFVVVDIAVSCQACPPGTTTMELVSGERSYGAQFGSSNLLSEDGFRNEQQYAFEVDPVDLTDLRAEVRVVQFISGYDDVLDVDLGLTEEAADRARTELVGSPVQFDPQPVRTAAP